MRERDPYLVIARRGHRALQLACGKPMSLQQFVEFSVMFVHSCVPVAGETLNKLD